MRAAGWFVPNTGALAVHIQTLFRKHPLSNLPADAANPTEISFDFTSVITSLVVYPVKSCAGVAVKEALLLDTGLEFDRAWMVVDVRGEFLTQRELPRMALIVPQLKHYEMVLRAPGMLALHVKLDEVEAPVRVRVWDDDVAAFDMGATAAQWFTDFLGTPCRLVRFDPDYKRLSSRDWTGDIEAPNQFSDGFPVLVISQASLQQLNDKLSATGQSSVSMARFRPNIVLGNVLSDVAGHEPAAAHDEDRLEVLHITAAEGTAQLKPVKPCLRCPIPNIDPLTAASSPEVGDMLQSYRQDARVHGAITFGMNVVRLGADDYLLKVGQTVRANYRFD